MNNKSIITFIIGLPFSLIAGIFIFLFSYREYSRHLFDEKKSLNISFEAGFIAFLFFIILNVVIGFILSGMFK